MKKLILLFIVISLTQFVVNSQTKHFDFLNLNGPYFGMELTEEESEVFAPEIILREKQAHSVIIFSIDGTKAYWCYDGIWFSKLEQENWTRPRQLPFSKKEFGDDAPFLSPDGTLLYFTSKRPVNENDTSRKENIWVVDVLDSGWSDPRPLPKVINNFFQHWQFSVDKNGTIYFGHISQDNNRDLYYSQLVNGEYYKPLLLKGSINSELNENNPFISPDGDYLIFSRTKDRKPFNGGLFISYKQDSGMWSKAISLQEYITFNYGGNCPFVTQDGKYLFFLDIYDGKYQRYWTLAEFIEKLKPKSL